jgi:hypothetical protein
MIGTSISNGGGVVEDEAGEKFNVDVGGDDFKTNPDDAQRALKELVEGAIGAADLEGVDMKDATVQGFREGITLMPHQVQGRAWMRERETGKKCGGILADDVSNIRLLDCRGSWYLTALIPRWVWARQFKR